LIHSKSPTPEEILSFVAAWRRNEPLVIVPSTYSSLTLDDVRSGGQVRMIIYANQGLRAAVAAMQQTFACILNDGTSSCVEDSLTPLADLFALQDECIQQRTIRETCPQFSKLPARKLGCHSQ
jgi:phosphoenolpyruvate phosphomutase